MTNETTGTNEAQEQAYHQLLVDLETEYGAELKAAVDIHVRTLMELPLDGKPRKERISLLEILQAAISPTGYEDIYSARLGSTRFKYFATGNDLSSPRIKSGFVPVLVLPANQEDDRYAVDLEHTLKEANNLLRVNRSPTF